MTFNYIKRRIPFLYILYLTITQKKYDNKLIGEKSSFGIENPDIIFFIIRLNNPYLGLMAIYNSVLGYIRIAEERGYIPVVDLKNFQNGYLEIEEVGKKNAWEYYFEQPTKYTLEEAYRSKNVIFSSGISPREASPQVLKLFMDHKKKSDQYFRLKNKYLRIKKNILQQIESQFLNIVGNKRVIGITSRGSDIINLKGHAIQPTTNELIAKSKSMLLKWNCDYIFLASEEEYVVETFRKVFGNRLLINQSMRITEFEKYIPWVEISFNRENDKYLKGFEYLTTVVILSRCQCIIGSLIGATVGALVMNKGEYENTYLYDLGIY